MWIGSSAASPDSVRSSAADRLKGFGLKHSDKKASKKTQSSCGKLFGAPLDLVPLKNVVCCGGSLRVPTVVCDVCELLVSHLDTEGIFRKAGSQTRQRETEASLDAGRPLPDGCHAVDAACILKTYLRSLPEPLIGNSVQELLLRCSVLPEDAHYAMRLAILFLPLANLHLLHYILEFLKRVSTKSSKNKMDSHNLAVVMAPTIMPPPPSCPAQRIQNHVKLVKFFIENANTIGIVPEDILINDELEKKRKKRRSGSLTRMFTGLRKIVTSSAVKPTNMDVLSTPVLDKGAKRRVDQEIHGFSAKKRKEIVDRMPQHSTILTPMHHKNKYHKKMRLSITRSFKDKKAAIVTPSDSLEEIPLVDDSKNSKKNPPVVKNVYPKEVDHSTESDYVRISKSEYEAIKNRVSAIENRISQEFSAITRIEQDERAVQKRPVELVRQVQTEYEKTLEEAAMLSSPNSEHLARRLSRELKIRQPSENPIIMRSPSERKINVLRRRSRENVMRLTRTNTWTPSSPTVVLQPSNVIRPSQFYNVNGLRRGRPNTLKTGLILPVVHTSNSADQGIPSPQNKESNEVRISTKRPSSFHGVGDVRPKKIHGEEISKDTSNNMKWTGARAFMMSADSLENPLTGRASVAKLRSQMAGAVMAKARLFDGMTDSDSSLDKKVNKKPAKQSFARKARRNVSCDGANNADTSSESLHKRTIRSPGYTSRRHRPQSNIKQKEVLNLSTQLKDVIYDVCTPLSDKINTPTRNEALSRAKESARLNVKSPRMTPRLKKSLSVRVGGVGAIKGVHSETKKLNTPIPVRANHHVTPRKSPRLASIKSRHLI